MIQTFIDQLRANFYRRLERKTNWGRNELKLEFEQAVSEALAELYESQQGTDKPYQPPKDPELLF